MIHLKWKAKVISTILTIAMVFMLYPGVAYAADDPVSISRADIAADNSTITVTFSEGVFTAADGEGKGTGAVTTEDFTLTFDKHGGIANFVEIYTLKNSSGEALTGGEDIVVFHIQTTGKAMGVETIEIKPANGASIFGLDGQPMAAENTTGVILLHDKLPPDFVIDPVYPKAGAEQAYGSKQVEILAKAYENVTAWYVVVVSDSGPPTAQQVKEGKDSIGAPALASGKDISMLKHEEKSIIVGPLPASNTTYDAYLIIEDVNKNTMVTPKKVTVTTPDGPIEVSSITVKSSGDADTMKSHHEDGSLQMSVEVLPGDAANKEVIWSVTGKGNSWFEVEVGEIGAGFAYINHQTGFMNQGTVGRVTVRATATDGSGVFGEKDITITGIHMSSSINTLVGKNHTLKATPVPALGAGQQLIWASSNEDAITVDQDGEITAVGLGSANITATAPDGRQGITSITVNKSPFNYITSFSFPQQTAPASIDGVISVNIGVSEETDISNLIASFSLSDKASATVNGAVQVSGVTVNDFTYPVVYKVIAENGEVRNWTVTVSKPHVSVSSITVNNAGESTLKKGQTLQMSAEVLPVYANHKTITWSVINGTGTATIDNNGVLTAVTAGTVTVKATANDGSAVAGSQVITITPSSSGNSGGSSGGSSPTTPGYSINYSGGTVTDRGVTVYIPANAVKATIRVSIARVNSSGISLPGDLQLVSEVFDVTKDRSGNFDRDVTITLPFDKSKADKGRDELAMYWWNGSRWIMLDDIEIDWSVGTVSGKINHFTKFVVLAGKAKESKPEPEKPETTETITVLFNDIDGHWAESAINNLVFNKLITGYLDGSFKPERNISRAEFISILVKGFQLPANNGKVFNDTAGHWGQDVIATAYAAGIISGYNDRYFGPDDPVTREQMAVMTIRAARLSNISNTQNFTDNKNISPWATEAVAAAYSRQLISGYPDNTFRPQNLTTRAEVVSVISRALNK
ncbi:MAG: S-layer homology domain-containing protein [Syntrophomonadaceae bacterium]